MTTNYLPTESIRVCIAYYRSKLHPENEPAKRNVRMADEQLQGLLDEVRDLDKRLSEAETELAVRSGRPSHDPLPIDFDERTTA